ncbi:MAG: hypothetical protein QOE76_2557 [Frankiales bacterium]|jgi:uncharacterized damage-inducible protein DinB|nr:hypothetical protein [Frankiales bacterium]
MSDPSRATADVPYAAGEREMLLGYLQRQRDLVLWKVDGLSDHDAHRVGTTTGLTIHGIVDHLTDVERSWLRRWFAGRRGLHIGGIDAHHVQAPLELPGARLKDLVPAYVEESRRCDEIVAEHHLADVGVDGGQTLRWILHHLIEETSRHVGHLDLLRELADGRTGEAPGRP